MNKISGPGLGGEQDNGDSGDMEYVFSVQAPTPPVIVAK